MCFSISARLCAHVCAPSSVRIQYCVCVCVDLLDTALGAKTLEIALICILCVSSNHNHVTGSPRLERLIHSAERRPSCMLLLYIHFILQELCSQNGFIHIPKMPHNTAGRNDRIVTGRCMAHNDNSKCYETFDI